MKNEREPVINSDEDIRVEQVVGKSNGPIRQNCKPVGDKAFRLARETRFVFYRDNVGGLRFAPYDDKCPMHWQDIPDLNLTPEELSRAEINLHMSDEDMGNGFNHEIQKGRKRGSASKTIWGKGYKSSPCDKLE